MPADIETRPTEIRFSQDGLALYEKLEEQLGDLVLAAAKAHANENGRDLITEADMRQILQLVINKLSVNE